MIGRRRYEKRQTATCLKVFLIMALTLAISSLWVQPAAAAPIFASDDTEIVQRQNGPGPFIHTDVSVLTAQVTTSSPSTGLVIQFVMECELFTSVVSQGLNSQAIAGAIVWLTVDGVPVPVTSAVPTDYKVHTCTRVHNGNATGLGSILGANIESTEDTWTTAGFTWVVQSVGLGIHNIEVRGELVTQVTGIGNAAVHITRRSLTISLF